MGRVRDLLVAERARLLEALEGVPFLEPYPSEANFVLCKACRSHLALLFTCLWLMEDRPTHSEILGAPSTLKCLPVPHYAYHNLPEVGRPCRSVAAWTQGQ